MLMERLRQAIRVVESAATVLQTWQSIMRSTGASAPIQLASSALLVATGLVSPRPMFPLPLPGSGPKRLDLRARAGFLLNGLTTLGCLGNLVRSLVIPSALERANQVWRRDLARKRLWTRLTATERHGAPFTFAAAAVALLSGLASYRGRDNGTKPDFFPPMTMCILGQVFPNLPIYGMARVPKHADRWLRLLVGPALAGGIPLAIASLRSAMMSEQDYEERRREWERFREEEDGS